MVFSDMRTLKLLAWVHLFTSWVTTFRDITFGTEQMLYQLVNLRTALSTTTLRSANLLQLLKPIDSVTPPAQITNALYDFKDANIVSNAIQTMLGNLYTYEQAFGVGTTWAALVTGMESCYDPNASADTINARLSILIALTRVEAPLIMRLAWAVPSIEVVQCQIPALVTAMLSCDQVKQALATATAPHTTTGYELPRVIVVQGEVCELHGWVAMSNCVVISYALVHGSNTARGTLALFNVLGHQIQHGILRATEDNFNACTHELVRGRGAATEATFLEFLARSWQWCGGTPPGIPEEPDAGRRWQRAVWSDCCPRWYNPCNPGAAESLAATIVQRFEQSQEIGVTDEEHDPLLNLVGPSSAYGDAMFYEPEQYLF